MGAEAVLLGTGFMATRESPVHPAIKERLLKTRETETALIMRSLNNPLRCVRNKLVEEVLALESKGATLEEVLTKVAGGRGKLAYDVGDPEISPIACGQVVGLITEIKPVRAVIEDMLVEAEALLERLNRIAV
jgi:nitronate monooxygenase